MMIGYIMLFKSRIIAKWCEFWASPIRWMTKCQQFEDHNVTTRSSRELRGLSWWMILLQMRILPASMNSLELLDSATLALEHVQVLIGRQQLRRLPLGDYRTTLAPAYCMGSIGCGSMTNQVHSWCSWILCVLAKKQVTGRPTQWWCSFPCTT